MLHYPHHPRQTLAGHFGPAKCGTHRVLDMLTESSSTRRGRKVSSLSLTSSASSDGTVLYPKLKNPPIVVFYSFKGGVGRSTAVAAFAINRSRAGERVVVIDADLDAPGVDELDTLGEYHWDTMTRAIRGLVGFWASFTRRWQRLRASSSITWSSWACSASVRATGWMQWTSISSAWA